MPIKGGIVSNAGDVEMTITLTGGRSYKRVYNDVVSLAIDKFTLISTFLDKIIVSKAQIDTIFYVEQAKILLQRGHVELIQGTLPFHNKYNMWLLDGYVRMLLETHDMRLISQLLDLDSILYSIEEADAEYTSIDFTIPSNIDVVALKDIDKSAEIAVPISDELSAYLHSFNHNLALLVKLITANKKSLNRIYKQIINAASTRLT